jgi:hypothetical protein
MVRGVDQVEPAPIDHGRVSQADQSLAGPHGEGDPTVRRHLDQQIRSGEGKP